jgi:hypothetical protein
MAGSIFTYKGESTALDCMKVTPLTVTQEEHLTKILFTKAHALCHDVNSITKGPGHLDVVMGFSTGDIIWYEPMSQKYTRINKNVGRWRS